MEEEALYTPLHCRSHYSLLRGVLSPAQLCERAADMGASAVGLADINGLYGLIRFATEAGRLGLKALYGVAVYRRNRHLCTLYAKDMVGFTRMNEIITRLLASEEYDPVSDLLSGGWEGLLPVVRDPETLQRLVEGADKEDDAAERRGSAGRQRCEAGNRTGNRRPAALFAGVFYGYSYEAIRRTARRLGVPLFALNDAVYTGEEQRRVYRVVRAVGENRLVSSIPVYGGLSEAEHMVDGEEMRRYFSGVPEALENARRFAREAEGFSVPRPCVFPAFGGMDADAAFVVLRRLCSEGVTRRYGLKLETARSFRHPVARRLDYELSIIRRKGFASYFLVVHEVVRRFPRTCGRGSAAASIVSYVLGITHVDPIRHRLFFERFLNEERTDPPDIDVDFPWDERETALDYLFETYEGRVAMVADHVTFGPRSALREAARVMGYEKGMQDRFELLRKRDRADMLPAHLRMAARLLYGMPRHIGTHPGGVVITPGPITGYSHVQQSPMGRPLIAWEKEGAEDAGLVKIDILGNRSLGVLRDSIGEINRVYGTGIEWEHFSPLGEPETRRLIERGETIGVFYIESPATRQLLRKMGTGDYEHLVAASSIIRPAANRYIHEYVRRLRGGPYPRLPGGLDKVLEETCGIMVYQEDVSRIAVEAAGFSHGEADRLRKILSKKDRALRLPAFYRTFIEGGRARGFGHELLEELWRGILSFDGYSFCKPHSASYALLSYRLAWVKRHFPLVFFTAVLNNGGGFYRSQVYVNALRRLGFAVRGADVNESGILCSADYGGAALRLGLGRLRDLSREIADRIVVKRNEGGPYGDVLDFLDRVRPDAGSLRSLIRSGALDSVAGGCSRPQLFWLSCHRDRGRGLFGFPPLPREIGDYPEAMKLRDEVHFTGLFLRSHPLELFYPRISRYAGGEVPLIDSRRLAVFVDRKVRIAGCLVVEKEVGTKDRREMSFVSFEDSFGLFETVFFPDTYLRFAPVLESGSVFMLEGRVEREWGALQITVEKAASLNRPASIHGTTDRFTRPCSAPACSPGA